MVICLTWLPPFQEKCSGGILPPYPRIYVLQLLLYIIFAQKESQSIAFTSIFLLQLGVDAVKSLQPCLRQGKVPSEARRRSIE
jgi:hypothetical protein